MTWKFLCQTFIKNYRNDLGRCDGQVLALLDQEQSLILNSLGRKKVFTKSGNMELDIGNKTRVNVYEIN